MSKRTKRWLSIVTTLAVAFVMTFGCMGEVFAVENQTDGEQPASVEQTEPEAPAEETAVAEPAEQEEAAEGDVEVLGEGTDPSAVAEEVAMKAKYGDKEVAFYVDKEKMQMYYKDGENRMYLDNVKGVTYSAIKNTGTNEVVYNACGPKVMDILKVIGADSNIDGKMITFTGNDDYSKTFAAKNLFKTRYYYPNVSSTVENKGLPATDTELEDLVEVPVIINLNDVEGETQVCLGQLSPNDRNKPWFASLIAQPGGDLGYGSITVTDEAPETCLANVVATPVNGSTIKVGDEIKLTTEGSSYDLLETSGTYFTTDGTNPNMFDQVCAWYSYKKPNKGPWQYNYPKATKPGTLVVKVRTYDNEFNPSPVQTFVYNVVPEDADISNAVVALGSTKVVAGAKPSVSVKMGGTALTKGKDYVVSYSGYKKVGTGKVTVFGRDTYEGTKTAAFTVIPAKAKITKLTRGSKKLTVYYANQKATEVTKYKIGYKRSGYGWKYTTTTSTSKTIKSLKKGKKYYVKVQAIGSTGAGAWSDTKSIKVR